MMEYTKVSAIKSARDYNHLIDIYKDITRSSTYHQSQDNVFCDILKDKSLPRMFKDVAFVTISVDSDKLRFTTEKAQSFLRRDLENILETYGYDIFVATIILEKDGMFGAKRSIGCLLMDIDSDFFSS